MNCMISAWKCEINNRSHVCFIDYLIITRVCGNLEYYNNFLCSSFSSSPCTKKDGVSCSLHIVCA